MHTGSASVYDLTLLMRSDFPLCPFQTANKWFAISVPCIKGLTQPARSSCLLRPEQLRLSKCICRAAALICSLTGIVNQPVSSCGNQWMRGNCLGENLFHFCNSVSAFLHLCFFFSSVYWKLYQSEWKTTNRSRRRADPHPCYCTSVAGSSLQLSRWALFGSQWINIHWSSNCKETLMSLQLSFFASSAKMPWRASVISL